ncbi:MFS transporter [Streptomyces rishiriensis]|uniref:MFS family permease n=1 Tax=Streptomyces rishiriensis TaxID=68264 RepID=A0ABU0NTH4_STRRH|nr:MFS transporter [Streptomyces rishiriensis]MDQ0582414.1 MFS family permease [Streptomyces rishiriensis]
MTDATTGAAAVEEAGAQPAAGVWRNADFTKLWTGQTASLFAAQVSELALPLVAVLALAATSEQVGLLTSVVKLPYLLVSLFAGVLVDRVRRRNILIVTDLGRALVLSVVPVLYWTDRLGISWLYVLGFFAGCGSVLFDVAGQAYLPQIVGRDQLTRGNSALGASQSAATIGGPALGGVLVQWLTAPVAVLAGAASYLVSALTIAGIRHKEDRLEQARGATPAGTLREVWAGLKFVFGNEPLRAMTVMASIFNLSFTALEVAFLQFMPRTLGLSAGEIGLVMAALGPGFLVGAAFAGRLPQKFGYGRTMLTTASVANLVMLGLATVHGSGVVAVGTLMLINFLFASFGVANNVTVLSIRQTLTPDTLQGRVAATNRFVAMGIAPLGALVGGFLGGSVGLRTTVLVTAIGLSSALVPLALSSLARIRYELPPQIQIKEEA